MKSLTKFFDFLLEEIEVFSFEELKKYVGTNQRIQYLEKTLNSVGYGSSRAVYELSNNLVLKAGLDEKGFTQNQTEYELYHQVPKNVQNVLAAIKEPHHPNYEWIVMEKVRVFSSEEEFEQELGLSPDKAEMLFRGFCFHATTLEEIQNHIEKLIAYLTDIASRSERKNFKDKKALERVEQHKKMLNFTRAFSDICLAIPYLETNGSDLGRPEQLGKAPDGRVVIVDYGFGKKAYSQYNPTPYQQHMQQHMQDMDDNYDDHQEYDKYGNKVVRSIPKTTTVTPPQTINKTTQPDDIPF